MNVSVHMVKVYLGVFVSCAYVLCVSVSVCMHISVCVCTVWDSLVLVVP